METKARVSGEDFDTLEAAGNTWPFGIWSDGETMWVADLFDEKIYAYDMATKARVSGKDFDTLQAAENTWPTGIWSDGETMWVADFRLGNEKIYAYDMATKARVSSQDFNFLKASGNFSPIDIWSDGMTMWVVDLSIAKVYAYGMATTDQGSRQGIQRPGCRWQLETGRYLVRRHDHVGFGLGRRQDLRLPYGEERAGCPL